MEVHAYIYQKQKNIFNKKFKILLSNWLLLSLLHLSSWQHLNSRFTESLKSFLLKLMDCNLLLRCIFQHSSSHFFLLVLSKGDGAQTHCAQIFVKISFIGSYLYSPASSALQLSHLLAKVGGMEGEEGCAFLAWLSSAPVIISAFAKAWNKREFATDPPLEHSASPLKNRLRFPQEISPLWLQLESGPLNLWQQSWLNWLGHWYVIHTLERYLYYCTSVCEFAILKLYLPESHLIAIIITLFVITF